MPEFTRQELYDLVWSEPMKTLAARFDISDVGLAKTCQKANVPVPERGYWAKLKAGKPVFKAKLPPRGIGESGTVRVAEKGYAHHWAYAQETLDGPEPVEPSFPDDMPEILATLERANEEQRVRREKERVQGLLRQAIDLRKATDIRNFIEAIKSQGGAIDPSLLDEWVTWASAEADRIDPIKNGHLIEHMNDMKREPEPITDADFKFRE